MAKTDAVVVHALRGWASDRNFATPFNMAVLWKYLEKNGRMVDVYTDRDWMFAIPPQPGNIEAYLRDRLKPRVHIKTGKQVIEKELLSYDGSSRVSRIASLADVVVRKKFLAANPCYGVEFPTWVAGLFRPHSMG